MDSAMATGIAVSTGFAAAFLVLVWKLPQIARWVTGVGFIVASIVNTSTALTNPHAYVEGFGPFAAWGYRQFIYGPFASHTAAFVLAIAAGQFAVGILAFSGSRFGSLGAMVFLIAITPLGIGSGFPAPPIMAYAMWHLYKYMTKEQERSLNTLLRR